MELPADVLGLTSQAHACHAGHCGRTDGRMGTDMRNSRVHGLKHPPGRWHFPCICYLAPLVWFFAGVERPRVAQRALAIIPAHCNKEAVRHKAQRMCVACARPRSRHKHAAWAGTASCMLHLVGVDCRGPQGPMDRSLPPCAPPGSQASCLHISFRQVPHRCHRGRSGSLKSSTWRSSVARPAGPMPPCT